MLCLVRQDGSHRWQMTSRLVKENISHSTDSSQDRSKILWSEKLYLGIVALGVFGDAFHMW